MVIAFTNEKEIRDFYQKHRHLMFHSHEKEKQNDDELVEKKIRLIINHCVKRAKTVADLLDPKQICRVEYKWGAESESIVIHKLNGNAVWITPAGGKELFLNVTEKSPA